MLDQANSNLHQFINEHRCELFERDILRYLHVSQFRVFGYNVIASAMTIHNFDQQYRSDVLKKNLLISVTRLNLHQCRQVRTR